MLTFAREVLTPVELMGHQLEPGTVVFGSIYLTHRREDLYPEPLQFKPERFLERQFSPYEYLPFGGGSRRCIGLALAQLEMKLVLATILRDFDLVLAEKKPVQAKRRGVTLGLQAACGWPCWGGGCRSRSVNLLLVGFKVAAVAAGDRTFSFECKQFRENVPESANATIFCSTRYR
jgi:hypothetical protein